MNANRTGCAYTPHSTLSGLKKNKVNNHRYYRWLFTFSPFRTKKHPSQENSICVIPLLIPTNPEGMIHQ
ncbi:MAG: hypothetical protein JXR61_03270 [Prolixibacteraceae bacterium]|nr:hypothetical protein [Prolixibacteraceae bacterium]